MKNDTMNNEKLRQAIGKKLTILDFELTLNIEP